MYPAPASPAPVEPPRSDAHAGDPASTLPEGVAAAVDRGLRYVEGWVEGGDAAFAAGELAGWERELLLGDWDPGARLPLAVLAREHTQAAADRERVAWACLCVTEWALESGAVGAGLAFAEAAARAWPDQGRYAWAAGRLLRAHGREAAAETWLRRAAELAQRAGDWEGQARSLAELVESE